MTAYRLLLSVLSRLLLPLSFAKRHARAALRPRLGMLSPYPPRKLKLPDPYICSLPAESLPSISLITPSFQQAQFIGRTIESVLSQGYPKLEYFVQDGGSTDGTVDVLQQYGDRLTEWLSEKDGGQIDESFRFAMDWDLLLRLRDAGACMVRMPDLLGAFRIHEAQKTSAQINDVGMGEMARLRRRALGREVTWLQIRGALWPYMMKHIALDLAYRVKK